MKRSLTLAGIILAVLAVFLTLIYLKKAGNRPERLLAKLRTGTGDTELIKMKLNLVREDIVPALIDAFRDETTEPAFRVEILELLFRKYRRTGDTRIEPVLLGATKHGDARIRQAAVEGVDIYGTAEQRLSLIDRLDDPQRDIRRMVLLVLTGGRWESDIGKALRDMPEEQRSALIQKCVRKMKSEEDEELRFLARAVVGREIERLCELAQQKLSSADYDVAEKLLHQALELDPENHQARVRLVRHYLHAGLKKKGLELAEKYHAILHVPLLPEAPTIDGDPTDPVWEKAYRCVDTPFYLANSQWAPKFAEGKADFYIGHRNGTVYLAVLGYEDDLDKLTIKHKGRDSPCFLDDCVELFFDPDNDERHVYQFVINPIGTLMDLYQRRAEENVLCQVGAKIFKDRGYWSCEFAVAAKDLGNRQITAESIWGINVMRTRIGPASEQCAWWPTFGSSLRFHLYPIAVFEGLGKSATAPATQPAS